MLHRLREAWAVESAALFDGPVEVDETYAGGEEANKRKSNRGGIGGGTGAKTAEVGARDRKTKKVAAKVIDEATTPVLRAFVAANTEPGATVYTGGTPPSRVIRADPVLRGCEGWTRNSQSPGGALLDRLRGSPRSPLTQKDGTVPSDWNRVTMPLERVQVQTQPVTDSMQCLLDGSSVHEQAAESGAVTEPPIILTFDDDGHQ